MGRPLNKKYFGNRNIGTTGAADDGIGGQGIASVTIAGEFSGFTAETTTVTFSAPTLPGGVTATGTATIVGDAVTAIVITEKGSGYVSAPTVDIEDSDVGAEVTTGTATAVLTTDSGATRSTTNQENAIRMTAFLTGGSALEVDVMKQVSTRRYTVTDGTRTGKVTLVSTLADAAGEGSIAVLDSAGGEYFATKITAHRVTLTRAGGSGHLYATGTSAPWKLATPVGMYVQLANA